MKYAQTESFAGSSDCITTIQQKLFWGNRRMTVRMEKRPEKLLDQLRETIQLQDCCIHTEEAYVNAQLSGNYRLMAQLLYGSGWRLMECARLRVEDVDFSRYQTILWDGEGVQDPVSMLPAGLLARVQEGDLARGYGTVYLPFALERTYPNANRE